MNTKARVERDWKRDRCARYAEDTLKAYRSASGNMQRTASDMGVSYSTINNRLHQMIQHGYLTQDEYDANAMRSETQTAGVDYREKAEDLARRIKAYEAMATHKGTYQVSTYKPTKSNAVAVAVASDWHAGEAVDPADLPGNLNEYNPKVFQRRATQFFQRALYMTQTMGRSIASVDTMVVALLGDLMTGFLHEDQSESNHLCPMEEILLIEEVISSGIEYLLSKGDMHKIILPCCAGNHGRTSEKMRSKTLAKTSYEILLYRHLAKRWEKEKRLEWHIATGYQVMLKLWDYTIRFHHGDAVNYGGGVGGLTIPLRKAISGWNTVQHANLDVCGHFHQMTDGGDFIVNGSLIGYNAYALRVKARYEPPQQAWFLVDHKRGKTVTARLFTDAT